VEARSHLLEGKVFSALLDYAAANPGRLWVMGRLGQHACEGTQLGSNTEAFVRQGQENVLVTVAASPQGGLEGREESGKSASATPEWTPEALEILGRIPIFVRPMVRKMVEKRAGTEGVRTITADYFRSKR